MDDQLAERKMKLEEERLRLENTWKEADIGVRESEIKHNNSIPLVIAAPLGVVLAALFTVLGSYFGDYRIEVKQQEADLILSAVQTWDQTVALRNLEFLVNTYLISDAQIREGVRATVEKIRSNEGEAPNFGPVPTPAPNAPVGEPFINPPDGAVYLYVPPGTYPLRSRDTNVTIDGFWIKQTEVTNSEYVRCVEAKGCGKSPDNDKWRDNPEFVHHPVTNVSRDLATDYATWASGRLPTADEWEIACGGGAGRDYPWGNKQPTADNNLANWDGTKLGGTAPVGSFPNGRSPFGLLDMAGNVSEIVVDSQGGEEQPLVASGGFWANASGNVMCKHRGTGDNAHPERIGFRVVLVR
jgi:formylglycine-generating enzyme required for sulfatase activity